MGVCRLLPHGGYALVCAVLSTMAWLSSLFQDGCDFARLTGSLVPLITQNQETPYLDVGFAQYRAPTFDINSGTWQINNGGGGNNDNGSCQSYPSSLVPMDGHWKAAKGFDFLALVLGGGGTLFLWFSTCFVFSKGTWRWAGIEVLLASLFQALAFVWFGTSICTLQNNDCTLSWGSRADIVATVFWFVTSVMILCRYPHPKDDCIEEQQEQEQGGGSGIDGSGGGEDEFGIERVMAPSTMVNSPPPPMFDSKGGVTVASTYHSHSTADDDFSPADGDNSRHSHLSDVPLEGDATATMMTTGGGGGGGGGARQHDAVLHGPTTSMTDAEVV